LEPSSSRDRAGDASSLPSSCPDGFAAVWSASSRPRTAPRDSQARESAGRIAAVRVEASRSSMNAQGLQPRESASIQVRSLACHMGGPTIRRLLSRIAQGALRSGETRQFRPRPYPPGASDSAMESSASCGRLSGYARRPLVITLQTINEVVRRKGYLTTFPAEEPWAGCASQAAV
jgi:hypothetical protein